MHEETVTRPPLQIPRRFLLAVLGILFLVSVISLPQYLRAKRSLGWPTTQGVITVSELLPSYFKGTRSGCLGDVHYRYRVGDREYESTALSLAREHPAAEDAWQREIDRLPVGKAVTVYYDPKHPEKAILQPGLYGDMNLLFKMDLLFVTLFAAAFIIVMQTYED